MDPTAQIVAVSVGGAAVLGLVYLGILLVKRKGFKSLGIRVGPAHIDLQAVEKKLEKVPEIAEQVEQINSAVNHVAAGEPPLVERVRVLDQRTRTIDGRTEKLERQMALVLAHMGIDDDAA